MSGEKKVDVLTLGWWADGGPLLTAEGVRQVFEVFEDVLPEALPSHWDVDESYRHRLDQEGVASLIDFVDRYRDSNLSGACLRAKAPAREITLSASEQRWGTRPGEGVFETVHLYVEFGPRIMGRRGATDRLGEAFRRVAEIMDVFYAEARWLHDVTNDWNLADLHDQEVYPFEYNRWCGLPVRAPSAALLGTPYADLWQTFGNRAQGTLRYEGPQSWSSDMPQLPWKAPVGLLQPFDRHWKELTADDNVGQAWLGAIEPGTAFQLTAPAQHSLIWPFSARVIVPSEPRWERGRADDDDPEVIRQITNDDQDGEPFESWERVSTKPDLRGLWATRIDQRSWTWSITVSAMEFVRGGAGEEELRQQIEGALVAVFGVTAVAEEDREVWLVQGTSSGRDLISAVAGVIDAHDEILRLAKG